MITGSDNGLAKNRHQAIVWTNADLLLIEPPGTNFGEISIKSETYSFQNVYLKMSSAKLQPFCLGHKLLPEHILSQIYATLSHH